MIEKPLKLKRRFPAKHQLGERRGHGLWKDIDANQLRGRAPPGTAPLVANVVEADELQTQTAVIAQPFRAPMEERAVDVHLFIGAECVRCEMFGRLDAADGVVGAVRLVIDPAFDAEVDIRHPALPGKSGLRLAQRESDAAGHTMRADEVVQQCPPAAADVEHPPTPYVELGREEVEFATLSICQGLAGHGIPECAGVDKVTTEPKSEELVREIVVMCDRGGRGTGGAERRRVDHHDTVDGPFWSAASSCAAMSRTVFTCSSRRSTSTGNCLLSCISSSTSTSAAASESTPISASCAVGSMRATSMPHTLTIAA